MCGKKEGGSSGLDMCRVDGKVVVFQKTQHLQVTTFNVTSFNRM
jgi:hypothetical protein